jgi:transcriptional regulator with XRE-family HTH domain
MNSDHDEAPDAGFCERMNVLEALVESWADLARKSGLSRRVLDKYRTGKSDPSRARLVALAKAADVRVDWLATGEGPMRPGEVAPKPAPAGGIDRDLLALVHKGVAEVYRAENARISADPLADEVARIYDDLVATYDSSDERRSGLKLALHQLRRELHAPASGASRKEVS